MAIEFPGYVNNPLAGLDVGLSHLAGGVDRYLQNKWRRDEEQDRIDRVMRAISGQGMTVPGQADMTPITNALGGPALAAMMPEGGGTAQNMMPIQNPAGPATSFQEALSRLANMGGVKSVEDIQLLQALAPQPRAPIKGGPGETFYDPKTYKPLFSVPSAESDKRITLTMYNSKTGQKYEQAVKESEYDKKREQLLSNGYTSEAPAPKVDRSAAWTEYQDALGGGFKGTFMQYQEKKSSLGQQESGQDFQKAMSLSTAFHRDIGQFPIVAASYSTIKSSLTKNDPTGASDMALVFSFMKLLDPTSVVRESEYANAENARGVPADIRAKWNKMLSGEKLDSKQRSQFVEQANRTYQNALKNYKKKESNYYDIAKSYNLNPKNIFTDYTIDQSIDSPTVDPAQQANQAYGTKFSVVLE